MLNIRAMVRNLIGDIGVEVSETYTYKLASLAGRTWTLSEPNVIESTLKFYKNNLYDPTDPFTFIPETIQVEVDAAALTLYDEIRLSYRAYKKYSDNEIDAYIESALIILSVKKYGDFENVAGVVDPVPELAEQRLIALIASVLIDGNMVSYSTKEFSVEFKKEQTAESRIESILRDYDKSMGVFAWVSLDGGL
jgi:hypothetical protein